MAKSNAMQIKDYHIFELVRDENGFPNRGGIFWFNTYTTKDGKKHFIVEEYNDEGKPLKKNIVITEDNPLMLPVENTELYAFLVAHPNFVGGNNYNGTPVFRLVDLEREAKVRTADKVLRAKAIAHASQLEGTHLYEMCSMFGAYYNEDTDAQALEFIILQAERDPQKYLDLSKRSRQDVKIRYLLAAAIRGGIVQKTNSGLRFGSLTIGVNEDNAVARLITEPETLRLISTRVNVSEELETEPEQEVAAIDREESAAPKFPAPKRGKGGVIG